MGRRTGLYPSPSLLLSPRQARTQLRMPREPLFLGYVGGERGGELKSPGEGKKDEGPVQGVAVPRGHAHACQKPAIGLLIPKVLPIPQGFELAFDPLGTETHQRTEKGWASGRQGPGALAGGVGRWRTWAPACALQ